MARTHAEHTAAAESSEFGNYFKCALCAIADDIGAEAVSGLSVPAGFRPDESDTKRKERLHDARQRLAYNVLNDPSTYATALRYSAATYMDCYLDTGTVKMDADSAQAENADYTNAISALWNSWSVQSSL